MLVNKNLLILLGALLCAPLAMAEESSMRDLYETNKPPLEEKAPLKESEKSVPKKGELTDQEINAAVQQVFAEVPDLAFFNIQVQTVNGEVFLSATVRNYRQYQRTIEYAQGVPGVKKVNADKLYYFEKP